MTLREQIIKISIRWINKEFHNHVSFPRIVDALAIIAFSKAFLDSGITTSTDYYAIWTALKHLNEGNFNENLPAVSADR